MIFIMYLCQNDSEAKTARFKASQVQTTYIVPPWCSNTPCQYALCHLWCEITTQKSSSLQCFSLPASRSEHQLLRRDNKRELASNMVSFNRLIYRKNKTEQIFAAFCLHVIVFKRMSYVPCIGRPSCERIRIQWSDMLRITRGCKATETLPVTPEAITLGLAENRKQHHRMT